MGIPSTINTQIPINSIGAEILPSTIELKNTMWNVFILGSKVVLREYDSNSIKPYTLISPEPNYYTISHAYVDSDLSEEKFWLWTVEGTDLYVREIEPIVGDDPIISLPKLIESNVKKIDISVGVPDGVRVVLTDTNIPQRAYIKIFSTDLSEEISSQLLSWDVNRLDDININSQYLNFKLTYLSTTSPANAHEEEYEAILIFPKPVHIKKFNGVTTKVIQAGEIFTINGINFTDGGEPTVYVNGEFVEIVSFSDTQIDFIMPELPNVGVHILRVENGNG